MQNKPGLALKITGWMAVLLLIAGHFFRMMYWPGAGILIIAGTLAFVLFYSPLWVMQVWKEKEGRWIRAIQFYTLIHYGLAVLWKTMHWPGAGMMMWSLYYYGLFFFLPFSLYLFFRAGKHSVSGFHGMVLLFLIVSSTTSAISRGVSGNVVNAFALNGMTAEAALVKSRSKSRLLYEAFKPEDSAVNPFYKKAQKLRTLSDSATAYIRNLRRHLVCNLEKVSPSRADSLSLIDIVNKTNYDIGNSILIGDLYRPRQDHYSGEQLKQVINAYRDSATHLIGEGNRELISSGFNLSTEGNVDESGEPVSWPVHMFYNIPAISVLSALTGIEYEVKNAENQILSDLINSSGKRSGSNIAARIAELGEQLEKEKRDQELKLLKKESELSTLRLNAKNSELAEQQQTIAAFIMGLVLAGVMLFFIIRSNLIRKRINKELSAQKLIIEQQKSEVEKQKHLLEVKQKEVMDSIRYARRIQQSLLPTDLYMSKNLGKRKD